MTNSAGTAPEGDPFAKPLTVNQHPLVWNLQDVLDGKPSDVSRICNLGRLRQPLGGPASRQNGLLRVGWTRNSARGACSLIFGITIYAVLCIYAIY